MRIGIIILVLFIFVHPGLAQETVERQVVRNHSISLELLGASMPYSISYAYLIHPKYELRAGVGYFGNIFNFGCFFEPECEILKSSISIPLVITNLIGSKRYYLEINAGLRVDLEKVEYYNRTNILNENRWNYYVVPIAGLGFRYSGKRMLYAIRINNTEYLWGKKRELKIITGFSLGFKF